jgi:hypothetical protein
MKIRARTELPTRSSSLRKIAVYKGKNKKGAVPKNRAQSEEENPSSDQE